MNNIVDVYQGYPFEFEFSRWPRKDIEQWCEEHCTGMWKSQLLLGKDYSTWTFTTEKDAMFFKLKWT